MAIRVLVISKLHQGYHRAGQAIAPGESELVVSDEQCAALEGDPRLSVFRLAVEVAQPAPTADTPPATWDLDDAALGSLTDSGDLAEISPTADQLAALADMKADDLRTQAVRMLIPGAASMKKAELVAAITAAQAQQPAAETSHEPNQQGGE
ncbi:MAG: HI1506-related protein [Aeromonas sp.]|uniref:HI1506-related protein n=1 Tax=Aeromonas sp. TaxID=647 RepID=UPI002FCABA7E